MTNLNGLYFNEYTLNFLTQFILMLVMLVYFVKMAPSSKQIWPFLLFFTAMALYAGSEVVRGASVWSREFYAFYLRYMMLYLALIASVSISYYFPVFPDDPFAQSRKKEWPIVATFFIIAFLLSVGWGRYQWHQLKPGGNPNSHIKLLDSGISLSIIWYIIVLFRRLWAVANLSSPRRFGWRHLPIGQQNAGHILYQRIGLVLFSFPMTIIMVLVAVGFLPTWWREVIPTIGLSIVLFLVSMTFLNTVLSKTTFMVHIVGITLMVVFLALGIVGIAVAHAYTNNIFIQLPTIPAQTLAFAPQAANSYTVTTRPGQPDSTWGETATTQTIPLPFDFPFGNQTWSQINLIEPGIITLGKWSEPLYAYNYLPAISVYAATVVRNGPTFIRSETESVTVTWPLPETADKMVQIKLYANGGFDLTYPELSSTNLRRIGFQSGTGGTHFTPFDPNTIYDHTPIMADGLLIDYDILRQQFSHNLMMPLVILVLIFSLLSVIGFPLLFRVILIEPLQALVRGVREVEGGNLDVVVPIFNENEIGLVTHAFNQMVSAVRDVARILEIEIEKRTQELAENQRQLGALEERERIGREIHDGLGQVMGYVQVQVEAATARLQHNQPAQAQAILTEVQLAAQEAHNEVRQYILGIRTGRRQNRLDDFWSALDAYLALIGERYGLTIELTTAPNLRTSLHLTSNVETQLLRIIQEAITNVYKHAQATLVQLFLTIDEEWLTLILKDNGRGFDLNQNTAINDHFGLKIMQERAESVNGRLQIITTPGKGTQLHLQIPYTLTTIPLATDMGTYPWRVLLVDDHSLFREGLGNMLRPYGIQIVGMAENGREAESKVAHLQPDLILMDIQMPEQDGLETTRHIKELFPHIKIIMLTMSDDEGSLLQALKYGASGYLLKNLPAPEFLALLKDVMDGKTIVSPSLATSTLTTLAQQDDLLFPPATETTDGLLTARQQDVLICLGQGMSNKQISEHLYISESTVKYHIRQMMERLQLQTRHELIRYKLEKQGDNHA